MIVIAHRAKYKNSIENTLQSIELCLNNKIKWIEIDVRTCSSGVPILMHDKTIERVSTGIGEVSDLTYSELKKFRISRNNEAIPSLEDVVKRIKDESIYLNCEIKNGANAYEIYEVLKQWISVDKVLISSYSYKILRQIRDIDKNVKLGLIMNSMILRTTRVIKKAKKIQAYSIHPSMHFITPTLVSNLQEEGFKVFTHTPNSYKQFFKCYRCEVDGVITNYPERAEWIFQALQKE